MTRLPSAAPMPAAPNRAPTSPPESPCIGVCAMAGDVCVGCGRTLDEIAAWPEMSDAEKSRTIPKAKTRLGRIRSAQIL